MYSTVILKFKNVFEFYSLEEEIIYTLFEV